LNNPFFKLPPDPPRKVLRSAHPRQPLYFLNQRLQNPMLGL